jgi:hypothetical protein
MKLRKSTILIAVAWLLLGASAAQAQTEVILFKLTSQAAVHNNPSQRTMFRLDQPAFISKMFTYHWNNGWGAGAGRVGLRNAATGQMVGMWNAVGTQHMFDLTPGAAWPSRGDGPPMLHWAVQPNVQVPPGTYEIVDSDPGTWASNAEMGNRGCAWVFGTYGGGGTMPSPPATPQVQPTPTPTPASADINGMWRSGNQNFIFYQEGQTIKVIDAYRNGNQLMVWYGEGWIHGNQVHYRLHHTRNTAPNAGDDIHEFTVSADGNTMTGAWNVLAGPPHGGWTLQRIGP